MPVFVIGHQETIIEGHSLSMNCSTNRTDRPIHYTWVFVRFNSPELQLVTEESLLYFPSVHLENTGNYTCMIYNGLQLNETTVPVFVVRAPRLAYVGIPQNVWFVSSMMVLSVIVLFLAIYVNRKCREKRCNKSGNYTFHVL